MKRQLASANTEKKKLNKRLMRQTLRGYRLMNQITTAEEYEWARRLTAQEAWRTFEKLYLTWKQTGARAGGDWEAVDRMKIAELIQTQKTFVRLAKAGKQR